MSRLLLKLVGGLWFGYGILRLIWRQASPQDLARVKPLKLLSTLHFQRL